MSIETIRPKLIQAKKIQLHTGMEGFDSPNAFGIYRHTGGKALGTTGKDFTPPDLNLFADLISQSIDECADWLDTSTIDYAELKGGAKVRISIEGPKLEPKIKTVGTIVQTRLDFMSGFDGLTKTSLGAFTKNLWCENGAAAYQKDAMLNLSFKNTPGNQGKWALFCNEIIRVLNSTSDYLETLNRLATIQYTQKEVDAFFTKVLGYSQTEYKDITTRKRNILDSINACVAIESQANGTNLYSLLQGVTRYTTHELAGGDMDKLLTDTPAKMNMTAHQAVYALAN